MIRTWIFILSFLCFLQVQSQVEQTLRYEFPLDNEFQSFQVASLDTLGILTYRRFSGPQGDQLELTRLDTAFRVAWKGFMPVSRTHALTAAKIHRQRIFLFMRSVVGKPDFRVIAIQAKTGAYATYDVKNLIAFNPSEFVVTEGALLIGGYFNYRPLVLHFSLSTLKSKVLPGFLNEPGEINQIYANENGNVDILVSAKVNKRKSMWIRTYDKEGDLVKTVVLEPASRRSLIFGRTAKVNNDTIVIAGVYGRNAEYSRGIFVAEVNAFGEYVIHYYNFADLKNFFHYMKPKREKRVKERIERRKMKGKKNKFNYRILVHELIPYQNKLIMLGEAFYPHYNTRRTNQYPTYSGYYSPYAFAPSSRNFTPYRNDLVFDGFEYTHAVALGIDSKGKLVWDNSFRINDIRSMQLEQFVKIVPERSGLKMLYLYDNNIRIKEVEGNEAEGGNVQNPIKVKDTEVLMKSNWSTSKLEYWYGQNLFIYGTQTVKIMPEGKSQVVFFINKVEVK